MTTHAPRFPFRLHPLVAEAKQRTRRRRLLLLAALALVLAGSAAGVIIARSPAGTGRFSPGSPATIRSCGWLGVGIGWHLFASSSLSCGSGTAVMRAYFHGRLATRSVLGYTCSAGPANNQISCVSGETRVTAFANH